MPSPGNHGRTIKDHSWVCIEMGQTNFNQKLNGERHQFYGQLLVDWEQRALFILRICGAQKYVSNYCQPLVDNTSLDWKRGERILPHLQLLSWIIAIKHSDICEKNTRRGEAYLFMPDGKHEKPQHTHALQSSKGSVCKHPEHQPLYQSLGYGYLPGT